jgi:ribonuclease HI
MVSDEPVTNNQAELRGIRKILKVISDELKNDTSDLFKNREVVICSDSLYSINCVTKWIKTWIKNGWVNSKGEAVKNKELIKDIVDLEKKIAKNDVVISYTHVLSHRTEPTDKDTFEWFLWNGNNIVDENIVKVLNEA